MQVLYKPLLWGKRTRVVRCSSIAMVHRKYPPPPTRPCQLDSYVPRPEFGAETFQPESALALSSIFSRLTACFSRSNRLCRDNKLWQD
jgi:hypothetical protein